MLLLHQICQEVATFQAAGTALENAWQEACNRHSGSRLPNGWHRGDRSYKPLKLSPSTLRDAWYRWQKESTPLAFRRAFKPGKGRMPTELVSEYRRLCTMEGARQDSPPYKQLVNIWRDGKPVPGLGTWQEWYAAAHPEEPTPTKAPEFPFTYSALQKYAPKGALRKLGNEGVAAMRREAPHQIMDYSDLRPAELYVSDDARLDILVIDDTTGLPTYVTIYLMMEVSCRLIVAYVMRPANAIGAADVDEMIKRGLQAGGIGLTYPTHLLFERGTVAISRDKQDLLERWSEGRLIIHRTGMDGGARHEGAFPDKPTGHWMGKAVIESFVRKLHLALMHLPGQTGNTYRNTPANLFYKIVRKPTGAGQDGKEPYREISGGRAAEAEMLAQIDLAFGNRLQLKLPLLTFTQLHVAVRDAITRHNAEWNHKYQDFETLLEAEVQPGVFVPVDQISVTDPDAHPTDPDDHGRIDPTQIP